MIANGERRFKFGIWVAACVVAVTAFATSLVMVNQVEAITPENQPNSAALMDKAKKDGWVRVIVILDIPATPEGYLPTQAHVINQRQLIASKQSALLNRIRGNAIRNLKRFKYVPLVSMMVTERGLQALLAATETAKIVEDAMFFPSLVQSIPLIGADDAHASGFTGQNQTIAILDSGVDSSHPFLAGKIVSEACFSTAVPILNIESTCTNGQASQIGPGSGAPCQGGGCDHGTHVAGIAAGGNSGIAFSGVGKGASIIAIQTSSLQNGNLTFFSSDLISAGEHVFSLRDSFNISAVNLSLGGGMFTSPCDLQVPDGKIIIDLLRSAGIASIAASGNDGFVNAMGAPACISSAISVGATDKLDQVPLFSNSASFLDLLAPGVNITSSDPGTGFSSFSGTSMAAPHVAGAFAVLRSKNPFATVDEILAALKNTGQSILDTGNGLVKPRIQVDLALTQIPGIVDRLPAISPGGIVNGASFAPFPAAVAPGSIVSVFGTNLAESIALASATPLPTTLAEGGLSFGFNDPVELVDAPLFFVSPNQMNIQVPFELDPGVALFPFATPVLFGVGGGEESFNVAAFAPGLFSTNQAGTGQGAIKIGNTGGFFAAPVGVFPTVSSRPVMPGEFIEIFSTGLGLVTTPPATGETALVSPLSTTTTIPTVTIGGVPATVSFSGLAPNFVGLYQVNVEVPAGAPTGDAIDVLLTIGGATSNTVTIAVQ